MDITHHLPPPPVFLRLQSSYRLSRLPIGPSSLPSGGIAREVEHPVDQRVGSLPNERADHGWRARINRTMLALPSLAMLSPAFAAETTLPNATRTGPEMCVAE